MSKRAENEKVVTIKQAIDTLLLSCKVEGKSYGTIECCTDKLNPLVTKNYHVTFLEELRQQD